MKWKLVHGLLYSHFTELAKISDANALPTISNSAYLTLYIILVLLEMFSKLLYSYF
jgi:hypothetical protein